VEKTKEKTHTQQSLTADFRKRLKSYSIVNHG